MHFVVVQNFSMAQEIAKGSLFYNFDFNVCNFHDVHDCPCFHTQVHTGTIQSVIKCLALNLSAFNFYTKYVCNLACTSLSFINIDNIANIANSAYVCDDVVSCTYYILRMFVRHNLYIAHVLSNFNNAISGTNRFSRGSSSAYSIDLSDYGFDWLAMPHVVLQTWGCGGNRFWRAKCAALDIDCVDFLTVL
jgi:hypothetical protein